MQYKPWIIVVIGIFHLLEPVAKVIYYSFLLNQNPFDLISNQFYNFRIFHIFNFFFTFPIAGFAILCVKKWSLPAFLLAQAIVIGDFIFKVPTFYQSGQYGIIISSGIFYLINIIMVTYFLGSSLKIAYLNPKVRWWESRPRYAVNFPGKSDFEKLVISDISLTGAYITTEEVPLSEFLLSFEVDSDKVAIQCQPVHEIKLYEKNGCGVKFIKPDKKLLKKIINKLDREGYKRRPEKIPFLQGLSTWLKSTSISEKIFPMKSIQKKVPSENDSSEKSPLQG